MIIFNFKLFLYYNYFILTKKYTYFISSFLFFIKIYFFYNYLFSFILILL